ncbi:RNA-directed DNA polymerase [Candidatus Saccharibacteria bacterium]|nr:RNA-directed DNA polymerase [Candidatus Saccharibacteria bacterium]
MKPIELEKAVEKVKQVGIRQWLLDELTRAFEDARKGKLKTYDEHHFEQNWIKNIILLRDAVVERRYEPSPSVAFVIFKPMVREIFAAPFRDRVIHHFLYNMQAGWWDRRFLYDSYSCRVGKGTLFGIQRAQKMMWRASENFTKEAYVIKLDIRGYFMSLPRQKLYERIKWGLDRQFADVIDDPVGYKIYKICDYLWRMIIFDDPASKAWKRGPRDNWNPAVLPPEKSLFTQEPGYGVVIGNLTSQLVSNIYLGQLDRFIYFDLGYKYYGRYVDDFYIMVPEEQYSQAKEDVAVIEKYLREELGLIMHKKKRYYQNVKKGMSFLGARVYPHCLYPSDRLQKNFRRAALEMTQGFKNIETIVSYMGIMTHLDASNYIRTVFEEMGWDFRI